MYQIDRREEVTSTNDICMEEGARGKERYVCSARCQTKGRGRLGRSWLSKKNEGIYLSILERPKCETSFVPQLSLVMGIAAAKALEQVTGLSVKLKWPNDIVVDGKKLSGILAQMQLDGDQIDYVVIGIGINLFHEAFPEDLPYATSVWLEYQKIGRKMPDDPEQLREKIENAIVKLWETYYNQIMQANSFSVMKQEYEDYLINMDQEVIVLDPKGEYGGRCLGVSPNGGLLVQTDQDGVKEITSGEVSVRGIYGYI